MVQQVINVGSAPNDGTGDTLRVSFTKANANFGELYGRAAAPTLALVATSGSYADLTGKPTIPAAAPLATPSTPGLVKPGFGLVVAADGMLTSAGGALPVTSTYTASGAIAPSDRLALVNSAAQADMTLAAGTTDGQQLLVKRFGAGTVTVTGTLDGAARTLTMDSSAVKESLALIWSASLATWLVGA